jgi:hypothetical protein
MWRKHPFQTGKLYIEVKKREKSIPLHSTGANPFIETNLDVTPMAGSI